MPATDVMTLMKIGRTRGLGAKGDRIVAVHSLTDVVQRLVDDEDRVVDDRSRRG
jgi:hypothetical protein